MDGAMGNKTDIKIFILFLLNEINYPLDYTSIVDVISENGYVGSFDFAEAFSELCEKGHIEVKETNGERLYSIASTGRMVAEELQGELLESIREKSRKGAMRLVSLLRRGAKVRSEILPRQDGKYLFVAEMTETEGTILKNEIVVSTLRAAEHLKERFDRNPEAIYRGILSVLTGEMEYLLQND